jgi:Zn-finger nucleic acid-binding protein
MTTRSEIEIDYCPKCRGVWLDRGELDKLIERAAGSTQASAMPPEPDERWQSDQQDKFEYRNRRYGKRRRGFLGDIFDFD